MKMKRILMLCFAALMTVGMVACEKDKGEGNGNGGNNGGNGGGNNGGPTTLVGTTWQDATGFITFSFPDATTVTMSSGGNGTDGTYTYDGATSSGTMSIAGVINYTFTVSGTTMNIMNENGEITFVLHKVEGGGSQTDNEMANTTWMGEDATTSHDYTMIFNGSNGVIYSDSWYIEDDDYNVIDEGDLTYMGNYTYEDGHGTVTMNNMTPEEGGAATLTGSFRVAEDVMQLTLSDGTDVTLTKFTMPDRKSR